MTFELYINCAHLNIYIKSMLKLHDLLTHIAVYYKIIHTPVTSPDNLLKTEIELSIQIM